MGAGLVAPALGVGLGLLSGFTAKEEAEQNNEAALRALRLEDSQARERARQQRRVVAKDFERAAGQNRASASSRGVGSSASANAVGLSLLAQSLEERSNINTQLEFDNKATRERFRARTASPRAAGITAGLSGAVTGVNIGLGISGLLEGSGGEA